MNGVRSNLQFLRRFYDLLLSLYPKGYREEYGSELQTVFDLSLDEAASSSGFEAGRLILRELIQFAQSDHSRAPAGAEESKNDRKILFTI
jgi:hypothetical protein